MQDGSRPKLTQAQHTFILDLFHIIADKAREAVAADLFATAADEHAAICGTAVYHLMCCMECGEDDLPEVAEILDEAARLALKMYRNRVLVH